MHILLTGATGYIGRPLAKRLLDLGHEVHAVVRPRSLNNGCQSHPDLIDPRIRLVAGDICLPGWGMSFIPKASILIHCAASTKLARHPGPAVEETNLHALRHLPDVCERAGAERVLHLSTAFVSPGADGVLHEEHAGNGPFSNPYEESKTRGERLLDESLDIPLEILRPGIVLPAQGAEHQAARSPLAPFFEAMGRSAKRSLSVPARPDVRLGLIRLGDVVDFIVRRLRAPAAPRTYWNLVQQPVWNLADAVAHLRSQRSLDIRLDPDGDHPLLQTWKHYLTHDRKWEHGGASRFHADAFAPINIEEFARIIAVEVACP